MNIKISSDGTTCVDADYYWLPIKTVPVNVKVQLLSVGGVASYGVIGSNVTNFWVGWCPLPKRKEEDDN